MGKVNKCQGCGNNIGDVEYIRYGGMCQECWHKHDAEKRQAVKFLTDLMATIAMAYYKKGMFAPPEEVAGFGRKGRLWVHESGEAGVSIDLYDLFDDGLPPCEHLTFDDQTHVAGMPVRQEAYSISYSPDREPNAVTLLCKDKDVDDFDDSFDLELNDVPEETLKSITAWIEGLMEDE